MGREFLCNTQKNMADNKDHQSAVLAAYMLSLMADPKEKPTEKDILRILGSVRITPNKRQMRVALASFAEVDNMEEHLKATVEKQALTQPPALELPEIAHVSCHPHPLKRNFGDNGWGCDGRSLETKCKRGLTDFGQTTLIPRFRCPAGCDSDLCDACIRFYK